MIIKLTQRLANQKPFIRKQRVIYAVQMTENFQVETWIGWVNGIKGDYLVEIADTIRIPVSEHAFLKEYAPYDPMTVCSLCSETCNTECLRPS